MGYRGLSIEVEMGKKMREGRLGLCSGIDVLMVVEMELGERDRGCESLGMKRHTTRRKLDERHHRGMCRLMDDGGHDGGGTDGATKWR